MDQNRGEVLQLEHFSEGEVARVFEGVFQKALSAEERKIGRLMTADEKKSFRDVSWEEYMNKLEQFKR